MLLRKHFSLLVLSFIILVFTSYASETIIQGSIKGFDGRQIKVGFFEDYLTFTKRDLNSATIKEGKFALSFQLESTRQLYIKVEDKQTILFAAPGEVYNIALAYDEEANQGQAYNKLLNISFPFPKAGETNMLIKQFNAAYKDFFAANYQRFVIKAAGKEIDEFIAKWSNKEEYKQDPFAQDYVNYTLANLADINNTPKSELYDRYLANEKIRYHQKEYMNFFQQFYQLDFEQLLLTKKGVELQKAIMLEHDLEKTRQLISTYKKIENSQLTELYLINGLMEVYSKKTIEPESNILLLEQIKAKGLSKENRLIAGNVIEHLQRLNSKQLAYDFALKNSTGETVHLHDLKGKVVYLGFWANWSVPSLKELKVIQNLEEKYGDKINFISINIDEDPSIFKEAQERNSYNWTFLHQGDDFELKEKYDVRSVPSYFLIDEQGKIRQAYAPNPLEIGKTLHNLSR